MSIDVSAKTEKASNYCAYCPKMCRFSCPVAAAEGRETVTPWGLMGLLFAIRDGGLPLNEETGEVFYHCTSCLRCQTFCRHDNDVPAAMREVRHALVSRGLPVPRPLQGLDLVMADHGSPFGEVPGLDEGSLASFQQGAEVVYMPACARRAREAGRIGAIGRVLTRLLKEPVSLIEQVESQPVHCCGDPLREGGFEMSAVAWEERLNDALDSFRLVVTDCASLIESLRVRPGAPRVMHLTEVFAAHSAALEAALGSEGSAQNWLIHDACSTGRRLGIQEAPREVLRAALGAAPVELWQCRDEAACCGAGGHYSAIDPEGADEAGRTLLSTLEDQGAQVVVTTDVGCKQHLKRLAGEGVEVFDLLEVALAALGEAEDAEGA